MVNPELALGTYRCRSVAEATAQAVALGAGWVDTAPNYAAGTAQAEIGRVLVSRPDVRVSTKVGYLTPATAAAAHTADVLPSPDTRHSIAPAYLAWQLRRNQVELARDRLDLVFLHNPDHHHGADLSALRARIRAAFTVLEAAVVDGTLTGYGVATWTGFTAGAFTVPDLIALARQAAGGERHHLVAVQLPVSLVHLAPLADALDGHGPLADAVTAGVEVFASAPLHGGQLPAMLTPELVDLIAPGAGPAEAALAVAASAPGVRRVLLSTRDRRHWQQAAAVLAGPPLPAERLWRLVDVLRT